MYIVYIIYSARLDRYYVGYTGDIVKRLNEHNSGCSTYTAKANDWILKYEKVYPTRFDAHQAERLIKKQKSRKYLENLIG